MRRARVLLLDAALVAASVVAAVLIADTNLIAATVASTHEAREVASFLAGIFFTSVFTVAPAATALGELARAGPLWEVALFGGLGALLGDSLIFFFVRDRFSAHAAEFLGGVPGAHRLRSFLARRSTRWFSWVLGGILIASPLPDELAVSVLGASRMRSGWFFALSFTFNALGVAAVGLAARAL